MGEHRKLGIELSCPVTHSLTQSACLTFTNSQTASMNVTLHNSIFFPCFFFNELFGLHHSPDLLLTGVNAFKEKNLVSNGVTRESCCWSTGWSTAEDPVSSGRRHRGERRWRPRRPTQEEAHHSRQSWGNGPQEPCRREEGKKEEEWRGEGEDARKMAT